MPREITGHNGESYYCGCDVASYNATDHFIYLMNKKTFADWRCKVAYKNIDEFWTLPRSEGCMLRGVACTAVGILQDLINATGDISCFHASVSLLYKYSPYYMELRVKCKLGSIPVEWTFPMVPTNVREIERQGAI